jgi:small-conductance mechanosensitive channel
LQNDALDKTIIPNSEAVNKIIINHSQIPGFPVSVIVPVNADQCVEKVTTLLQTCAQNFEPRLMRPDFPPMVSVADIAAGKVNYLVKVVVSEEARSSDNSDIAGLLRLSAMRALAGGGIPVG